MIMVILDEGGWVEAAPIRVTNDTKGIGYDDKA